jgi:hypothetical protein
MDFLKLFNPDAAYGFIFSPDYFDNSNVDFQKHQLFS